MRQCLFVFAVVLSSFACLARAGETPERRFTPADVFALEYASDPQISPGGGRVAYVRRSGDIMTDRFRSSIWTVSADGGDHRALVQGEGAYTSPRWSPSGDRLLFSANVDGDASLCVLHMDTRDVTTICELPFAPSGLAWSPDASRIAFTMFTPDDKPTPVAMPAKPDGAEWAPPAVVIDEVNFRFDGQGFLESGDSEIYLVPSDGGAPRRLTYTGSDVAAPLAWAPGGDALYFSANKDDPERDPIDTDLYELRLSSGELTKLTDRDGPEDEPAVSPDGSRIAFHGFVDRRRGYQVRVLSVLDMRTGDVTELTPDLDRSLSRPRWGESAEAVYFQYDDQGMTKLARAGLDGSLKTLAEGLGGATLGRPYPSASYSLSAGGRFATVVTDGSRPADVVVGDTSGLRRLTDLNADLLDHKQLAPVEELWVESSVDGLAIQAWVMRPPGFEPGERYPLILEIHGGPYANYGPRFSAENQLFAAAGYVVVYANPRGSTSYGEAFADEIHHNYPSHDYDDLIDVVDAVIAKGFVDADRLFVTGGSGGGVLTAWIVGKTDRFRAAVVAKPVINWISVALTTDAYMYFARHWFPGPAWERFDHYWKHSPLSLVGNVSTPTMLLTGEEDLRTPIAESEQYYQALQLRGVPTRLVRIPGAYHGIAARPSGLVSKVVHILDWFGRDWATE